MDHTVQHTGTGRRWHGMAWRSIKLQGCASHDLEIVLKDDTGRSLACGIANGPMDIMVWRRAPGALGGKSKLRRSKAVGAAWGLRRMRCLCMCAAPALEVTGQGAQGASGAPTARTKSRHHRRGEEEEQSMRMKGVGCPPSSVAERLAAAAEEPNQPINLPKRPTTYEHLQVLEGRLHSLSSRRDSTIRLPSYIARHHNLT